MFKDQIIIETERVKIIATVVEHLKYGKKEWLTIRLPDNSVITINKQFCEEVKDAN